MISEVQQTLTSCYCRISRLLNTAEHEHDLGIASRPLLSLVLGLVLSQVHTCRALNALKNSLLVTSIWTTAVMKHISRIGDVSHSEAYCVAVVTLFENHRKRSSPRPEHCALDLQNPLPWHTWRLLRVSPLPPRFLARCSPDARLYRALWTCKALAVS